MIIFSSLPLYSFFKRAPVEGSRRNLANAKNHVIACISARVELLSKKESFYSPCADIILPIHIHTPHTHKQRHDHIQITLRKPRVKSKDQYRVLDAKAVVIETSFHQVGNGPRVPVPPFPRHSLAEETPEASASRWSATSYL